MRRVVLGIAVFALFAFSLPVLGTSVGPPPPQVMTLEQLGTQQHGIYGGGAGTDNVAFFDVVESAYKASVYGCQNGLYYFDLNAPFGRITFNALLAALETGKGMRRLDFVLGTETPTPLCHVTLIIFNP